MLSDLNEIVQALAILLGAVLGILGTLYKREKAPLTRSDKVGLSGIVLACVLALTVLGINAVEKARESKAEISRMADEVARQNQLLTNVQRGLLSIKEFRVGVDFTVSATDPELAALVARWDAYINEAKPSQFDSQGYSQDGSTFISRDQHGQITQLYVNANSILFPTRDSPEFGILLPTLSLAILRTNAPAADTITPPLSALPVGNSNVDLALFVPLSLANYHSRETAMDDDKANSRVFVRLIYDRSNGLITTSGNVRSATSIVDTGTIVSLLDLPGRQIVLAGLKRRAVTGISSIQLTASTGNGRIWSGYKAISEKDLGVFTNGDGVFAAYQLRIGDFSGLQAVEPDIGAPMASAHTE